MLDVIPIEVLCRILSNLGIDDLIRLERVCKYLQNVTSDREVWKTAYRNSFLPRPPGPFHWQTTADLRSALVQSFRVERNWPPTSASVVAERVLPPIPNADTDTSVLIADRLLLGRWVLAYDELRLSCFDLDSPTAEPKWTVLYEAGYDQEINDIRCADYVSADRSRSYACITLLDMDCLSTFGFVFEVIFTGAEPTLSRMLKLEHIPDNNGLKFLVGPNTVAVGFTDPSSVEDYPGLKFSDPEELDELPPYLHPYHGLWVINTDTYEVYTLAPSVLAEPGWCRWYEVYIGVTHLFLVQGTQQGHPEVVEAFPHPAQTANTSGQRYRTTYTVDVTPPHYPYSQLHATHRTTLPENVYLATNWVTPTGTKMRPVFPLDPWIGEDFVTVSACDRREQSSGKTSPELLLVQLKLGSPDEAPKDQLAPLHVELAHVAGAERSFASEKGGYVPRTISSSCLPIPRRAQLDDAEERRTLVLTWGGKSGQQDAKLRLSGVTLGASSDAFPVLTRGCSDSEPLLVRTGKRHAACFDGPSGRVVLVREKSEMVLVDFAG